MGKNSNMCTLTLYIKFDNLVTKNGNTRNYVLVISYTSILIMGPTFVLT